MAQTQICKGMCELYSDTNHVTHLESMLIQRMGLPTLDSQFTTKDTPICSSLVIPGRDQQLCRLNDLGETQVPSFSSILRITQRPRA